MRQITMYINNMGTDGLATEKTVVSVAIALTSMVIRLLSLGVVIKWTNITVYSVPSLLTGTALLEVRTSAET